LHRHLLPELQWSGHQLRSEVRERLRAPVDLSIGVLHLIGATKPAL